MHPAISHKTALAFWRAIRTHSDNHFVSLPNPVLLPPSPNFGNVDMLKGLPRPLDILVASSQDRRQSKQYMCHIHSGKVPDKSIVYSRSKFGVVSPELCAMQIAPSLSVPQLLMVLLELCGTYDVFSTPGIVKNCVPLTTCNQIGSLLKALSTTKGSQNLRLCLQYCADNSASPMESALIILFCLPYKYGGFGIELPFLNFRIEPKTLPRKGLSKQYYVCDLFWPSARLAVEYDSDAFHSQSTHFVSDSIKRGDLAAVGIEVITITKAQIMNAEETEKIARLIAKRLGKRLSCWGSGFTKKRATLRQTVFDSIIKPPLA